MENTDNFSNFVNYNHSNYIAISGFFHLPRIEARYFATTRKAAWRAVEAPLTVTVREEFLQETFPLPNTRKEFFDYGDSLRRNTMNTANVAINTRYMDEKAKYSFYELFSSRSSCNAEELANCNYDELSTSMRGHRSKYGNSGFSYLHKYISYRLIRVARVLRDLSFVSAITASKNRFDNLCKTLQTTEDIIVRPIVTFTLAARQPSRAVIRLSRSGAAAVARSLRAKSARTVTSSALPAAFCGEGGTAYARRRFAATAPPTSWITTCARKRFTPVWIQHLYARLNVFSNNIARRLLARGRLFAFKEKQNKITGRTYNMTERKKREVVRFQFEVDTDLWNGMLEVQELAGITTKKELINNALTLFRWAALQVYKGNNIIATNPNGDVCELQMPYLESIALRGKRKLHLVSSVSETVTDEDSARAA